MFKLIVFLVIAAALWYVQNNYDFSGVKESAISKMKQEKTVNSVNSRRAQEQSDIYKVTHPD